MSDVRRATCSLAEARRAGAALALIVVALVTLVAAGAACGDVRIYPLRRDTPGGTIDCFNERVGGYATVAGDTSPTTGGGDGEPVVASTPEELAAYAAMEGPLVIQVHGLLALPASIQFTSDKTIYGDPATPGSGVTGAGLNFTDASNIIVRNLQISKAGLDEGDAITLLRSQHIWIDHCDLSSEATGGNYDGLIDITHASDFITVSWTAFHDHRDTSLVGHSENNADEDTGHLRVTYHHNWFARVFSGPRVRFGTAHVYNNQFEDIAAVGSFGVASESNASMLVEQNTFVNVALPITTTFMDAVAGSVWADSNRYDMNSGAPNIGDTTLPKLVPPYEYMPDTAGNVSASVKSCAGIGKIDPLTVDPLTF
jgi:pectate lyase